VSWCVAQLNKHCCEAGLVELIQISYKHMLLVVHSNFFCNAEIASKILPSCSIEFFDLGGIFGGIVVV